VNKLIILLLIALPFTVFAQTPHRLADLNSSGKEAIFKNDTTKAVFCFDRALELDSLNKIARVGYALTHRNTRSYQILTELLTLSPDDANLHILRAHCAISLEREFNHNGNHNEVNLWFGRTVSDYQWLNARNVDLTITRSNLDEAQAIWGNNLNWASNAPANPDNKINNKVKVAEVKELMPLTSLIGKSIHNATLDGYIQTRLNYGIYGRKSYINLSGGDILMKYSFTRSNLGKEKPKLINITYTINGKKDSIIKKVRISGNRAELAELFLVCWPSPLTLPLIKEKRVAKTQLLSDKIVYTSYNPSLAVITISNL
jgi:hypothetical protein